MIPALFAESLWSDNAGSLIVRKCHIFHLTLKDVQDAENKCLFVQLFPDMLDFRDSLLLSTWTYSSFWTSPSFSLQVIFIVNACKAILREGVDRFALLLPVDCFGLCRLLTPWEGQVRSDAVPDPIAHHVVTAAVCADQLSPVRGRDGTRWEIEYTTQQWRLVTSVVRQCVCIHSYFLHSCHKRVSLI